MSTAKAPIRPILSQVFRAASVEESARLGQALTVIASQDASLRYTADAANTLFTIGAMSEEALVSIRDRPLSTEFKIEFDFDAPKVVYLETIRKAAEAEGKYIRQTGGAGNYGHCKLLVEPADPGRGYQFIDAINGAAIPKEYVAAIDSGVQQALEAGVLRGYPVVDVKITLYDGSFHETDSNVMAFQFAGALACKEALRKASPAALEPMMRVELPAMGTIIRSVIAEVGARRGRIGKCRRRFPDREDFAGMKIRHHGHPPTCGVASTRTRAPSLDLPREFVGYELMDDSNGFRRRHIRRHSQQSAVPKTRPRSRICGSRSGSRVKKWRAIPRGRAQASPLRPCPAQRW